MAVIPYTFVLGQSHSGSTLLAFLCNAHPSLLSVGETSRIDELLPRRLEERFDSCSCGALFADCAFWQSVQRDLAERGFALGEPAAFQSPAAPAGQARGKLAALVESMLATAGKRAYVDASKHAELLPGLLADERLDLRIINLLRDGRAVVNAWRRRRQAPDLDLLIRRWRRQERLRREALAGVRADRVLTVRYEDLCAAPAATMRALFSFMDVDPSVPVLEGYKDRVDHHIIGNPMRRRAEMPIELDERWRQEFGAVALARFEALGANAVNRRLGYVR